MPSSAETPESLLNFVRQLADVARAATLPHFRSVNKIEVKDDRSPVTKIDRAAEAAMRMLIERHYPTHGIVGEEFGTVNAAADNVWVLDPIDGTRSYISGSPLYCTLVAFVRDGTAQIGVIDVPALDERWVGAPGNVWHNGSPCGALPPSPPLNTAVLATTALGFNDDADDRALCRLCRHAGQTRLGGDAFSYGCLASGYLHAVADSKMQTYDYLALTPIVGGVGGVISDWNGNPLTLASNTTSVLATADAKLHRQALAAFADGGGEAER